MGGYTLLKLQNTIMEKKIAFTPYEPNKKCTVAS